jgi:hypothetical protein
LTCARPAKTIGPAATEISPTRPEPSAHAVEYARRLYGSILDWYKAADTKAQVVLTANGTFLTILTGLVLGRPADTKSVVDELGVVGWACAGIFAAGVAGALASAVLCLHSQLLSSDQIREILASHGAADGDRGLDYDPATLWFFQLVARLGEEGFERRLTRVGPADEIEALADQSIALATRVERKHRWLNLGFALTGLALVALLATATVYVVRV